MNAADKASALCLRCGMCCDGTLFTHVPVTASEAEALRARGVEVEQVAEEDRKLHQCCAALKGTRCAVYEARPAACRRFRCQLLSALEEDEVSLKEATRVVEEARQRLAQLDDALPPEAPPAGASVTVRAWYADRSEHGGPLRGEAKRLYRETEAFLQRHFRGRFGHR